MASYKKVILKSDNISELTNDAGYITSSSGLTNGTLVSGTYKQGSSSAHEAQLWTNNQLRLNINSGGTTYLYGSLILSGNRTIGTQSSSHSLSINPQANLMLGSDSTDHIFIGNTGRNITMRGETTFSASTSGISYNDLSNKPSIFMHDYATVTGNPVFAGTTVFTGSTRFQNTTTQITSTTAWSGQPTLQWKFPGAGDSNFYGAIKLTRQGSSGYNSQLEFQTSVYNNNLRTVMTLNSAGSLHLDGTVYANGLIGLNSGGFAIGSIADYNRIDFQSGTFRTLFANGSIAPLQVGDLTASSLSSGNATFTGDVFVSEYIRHFENNDTNIRFQTDHIDFTTSAGLALRIDDSSKATFSQGVSVINSVPYLYVGDNVNNNSGTWDANIFLDSHANARLRIQQRSDAKNLELWAHGGYDPLIQATDSANYLRLGVGGNVGLELGKYSVYLRKATYVESLRANNSSGLITIYNQGYGSKGNLELNNITGAESTFTTRVNTGQIRFTDGSKTSFNHLNVSQWHTAYTWGNHASAGYLTAVPNAIELKTSSGHIKFFDTDEGDTADYFRLEKDGGRMRFDFYDNSVGASSNNIFMIGDDGQVDAKSFLATTQMAIDGVGFNKTNILNWNTAYGWGDHSKSGYLTSGTKVAEATKADYVDIYDTRSSVIPPFNGGNHVRFDFKYNTKDGLVDGGTFHTVMHVQQWSDNSGGKSHQLGFTDNNNVFTRINTNDTTWGAWVKLWTENHFSSTQISNWHTAYGWGDHSKQGYLKVDSSNHLTIQGHYYDSGNQKVATENHVSVNYAPKVNPVFSGQVKIDSNNRLIGGFGAVTTAGTTDWNHDSNAISGQGYTLLLGNATNGHGFDNDYYHPFNFEYARNDGYGNMTQLAVPYSDNGAFAFRTRYSGNWSGWRRIIDTGIISAYADKTPSWVPSSDPGYLTSFNISGTGSSIGTTTGHNFHIKTNNQYRISITDQGVVTIPNNTTVNSNLYVGGNVAVDNLVNYRGSTPLTLLANNVVSGNSGSPSIPHTFTLRGHSVDYNGNGSRLAGEGFLAFDSNVNWTGAQRRWAITNAYGMGINNAYSGNLTFLVGTDSNQTPSLGVNGALGTGTAIGMRIDGSGVIHARTGNSTNWNTAYGWGNHASAGYVTSGANTYSGNQTAPRFVISDNSHILTTGHWAGAIRIEGSGTEPMYIGNHHKADLKLLTHNTPRLTISDNGNSTFSGDVFIHKGVPQLEVKDTSNNTRGYIGINNGVLKVGTKDNASLHFQTNGTDRGYFLANGTFVTLGAIESGSHHPSGYSTVDLGHSGAVWRQIHATNMYTTNLTVDGRAVSGTTIDNIGQGIGAYNWGNHAEAGYFKNGSLITGSGYTNSGSYAMANDLEMTKKIYIAFDHGTANQKANIFLGGERFWGEIIVTVTSGYSHQNASGVLKVSYGLGLNQNGGEYSNVYTTLVSSGQTPNNFSLDDAWRYDSGEKKWYLVVSHLNANGNQAFITLEAKSAGSSDTYIHNAIKGAFAGSVYTNNVSYPVRGYEYRDNFNIKAPNLLVGSYLNSNKTTNVGSNANGITIVGEHAPTLSLWDTSSSGFHSHVYQVGSDMTIRSSGTLSLQVAGGTRAIRINSDKSVTFDGSIQSVGNTYVSGALYTDSLNRQTGGSQIKVNSGLNITGTTNGTELYLSNRLMVSGSNSYMRLRDENNASQATWEYTANEVRLYNNNAEDLWFGVNASKKLEINGSDGMVVSHSHHKFYNDIRTTIGRIRSYASSGALTIMNGDSGSWGVVNTRGINLGDWYRQPDYGQIAVGAYNFVVFKGDSSSSGTLLSCKSKW